MLVLSGMANEEAKQWLDEGDGDHSRCQAAFLTGAHAMKASGTTNATLEVGVSMDQLAARDLREDTQLASLELSLEANDLAGQCEDGYGCAYSATLAWSDKNTPLPMETNPRAVFEHLFGAVGTTETEARLRALRRDRSILDSVSAEITDLQRQLGRGDRSKLAGYLDSVRDIERRIQIAESQSDRELPDVVQPAGVPAVFEEYADLMFDLMLVAFQADLTRVSSFLVGREKSVRTFPEIGGRGPAPPDLAPPPAARAAREAVEDQHLPHADLRALPREDGRDPGRRRLAARPLGGDLRRRHGEQQRARSARPPHRPRRRRGRYHQGRSARAAAGGGRRWPTCT